MGITAFPFASVIDVPTARILGRDDAGTGAAEALTTAEVLALLSVYTTAQVDSLLSGKSNTGHTHAAGDITSGIIATARLATGTASASTYLRGDQTWAAVSAGVGGSTGSVDNAVLRADGAGGATLQASSVVITDNFTASPNATVNHASLQATGDTTNVSVSVVPKGTGSFSLQVPDGLVAGGDVRGANAIDLQTSRAAANQVASGAQSFAAGSNNRAAGQYSVAVGTGNITGSSASAAVTLGSNNQADGSAGLATGIFGYSLAGERIHSLDSFTSRGGQQIVDTVLRVRTTGTTAGSMTFRVRSGYLQTYMAQISGAKSDGTAVAFYVRKIVVKNVAGTLTLVNSESIGTDYEDNAATALTVDTSGANLRFQVTGITSETWTWCTVLYGMDNQW